jgi:hypothetical protein
MTSFRDAAVAGKLGEWTFTTGDVQLKTTDREVLASLFRCPEDRSKGDDPSCELVPGKADEPPVVRCRHHTAYMLETRYSKDAKTGKWSPEVVALPPVSSKSAPGPAGAKKQ